MSVCVCVCVCVWDATIVLFKPYYLSYNFFITLCIIANNQIADAVYLNRMGKSSSSIIFEDTISLQNIVCKSLITNDNP